MNLPNQTDEEIPPFSEKECNLLEEEFCHLWSLWNDDPTQDDKKADKDEQ